METCNVVVTFKSVDEVIWCDHSYETSLAVRLNDILYHWFFNILQNGILDFFRTLKKSHKIFKK